MSTRHGLLLLLTLPLLLLAPLSAQAQTRMVIVGNRVLYVRAPLQAQSQLCPPGLVYDQSLRRCVPPARSLASDCP